MNTQLTKQQQALLSALVETLSPLIEKAKVDIGQMVGFHINLNTDSINNMDKTIQHIVNDFKPKAVIGYQVRRVSWPQNVPWSSVVLFYDNRIDLPNWGPDWITRFVYVDLE